MIVLGLNAYHGDVSAALLRDGKVVAAVEEERFRRIKHWAGFPRESIGACLEMAGIDARAVDHFAISRKPRAHLLRKALFAASHRPQIRLVSDRMRNADRVGRVSRSGWRTLVAWRQRRYASGCTGSSITRLIWPVHSSSPPSSEPLCARSTDSGTS